MNINHQDIRLGRNQSPLDPRTLVHARYRMAAKLPAYPPVEDWTVKVPEWPMYENDKLGTCGLAGPGHMIQSWTVNGAGALVTLPDSAILKAYSDVGGYVPGDPNTDQGVCLLDMLKYWQKTGIGGHRIGPYVKLDATRADELCEAHHLYVGTLLGLDMPLAWQGAQVWDVGPNLLGDWGVGTWGGHCVTGQKYITAVAGVSEAGLWVVTWGGLVLVTWAALAAYCSEAYGILSTDFLKDGKSPAGLDYNSLAADLSAVLAMPSSQAIAYKAIPIPPFSRMVDTVIRCTAANAKAWKEQGYTVVGRYLGGASPQEVADITGEGMGILWFNYSRKNGWLPTSALGTQDAARDLGQAKSLSVPKGSTIMFDLEGVGGAAGSPIGHLTTWSKPVAASGIIAGCYADGQDKCSGVQLGAVPNLSRYMCGAAVGTQEPLYRGWSAIQLRPVNTKVCGVQVDVSVIQTDSDQCTPTMMVRS